MKSSLASFFSYLFMTSSIMSLVSALTLVIIVLRYFFGSTGKSEEEIARYIFIVLVISICCAPISLYISNKLGKVSGRKDEL